MDKLLWVLAPVVLAGAVVAVLTWRGRLPTRPVLNAAFSLLLMVYLLVTAGLSIYWVAHQHLPVFDWHCVFGYAMLVLLAVHLAFNFRVLWNTLARRRSRALGAPPGTPRTCASPPRRQWPQRWASPTPSTAPRLGVGRCSGPPTRCHHRPAPPSRLQTRCR